MFKKMSLKFKLIALFLLVGLVPVLVVGLLAYQRAQAALRARVFQALEMYSGLAAASIDTYFEDILKDASVMATTRDIYQSMNILAGVHYNINHPDWIQRTQIIDTLGRALAEEKGYALIYLTDAKGRVIYSTSPAFVGTDISGRNYIQDALQGRTAWSELFFSQVVNTNVMAVAAPVLSEGRSGKVLGTFSLTVNDEGIARIVHEGLHELGASGDAYLVNADGLLYSNTRLGQYTRDAALRQSINTRAVELLAPALRTGNMQYNAIGEYRDYLGNMVLGSLEVIQMGRLPMGLVVEIDVAEAFAGVLALRNAMLPIIAVSAVLIVLVAFSVALTIVRPVQQISALTKELAAGDFTVQAEVKSGDEIGQMAQNLNQTIMALSTTLLRVQEAAQNVSHAAAEISSGNQDLSQRTEEQASSLEEISSTMEEITSSMEASSANAAEADNLSRNTMQSVRRGEGVVKELQEAMGEITRGSREISEIISTVNDIAFQTNLLALNAAVEAARAGEQGRGFAVVAAEVRNLAGRSAASAKEIEKLIKASIERVDRGNNLMGDTEKVLQEIVTNTQKASDVVGEIAASLREQASAAADIRTAIEELNQVTQQNASLVEEIASSSENMTAEATDLSDQVSFFKLKGSETKRASRAQATRALPKPAGNLSAPKGLELDEGDFEKF